MKKITYIIVAFICFNSQAQEKRFNLSKQHTIELNKSYGISYPSVFNLQSKEIAFSKFDTIKTLTKEYIQKLKEEDIKNEENLKKRKIHSNSLKDYDRLLSIKKNIEDFINSNERFKNKKKHLINAQIISDSLHANYKQLLYQKIPMSYYPTQGGVIYSEKMIYESGFQSTFYEIKSNKDIFYKHLSLIVEGIEKTRKPIFDSSITRSHRSINYSSKSIKKYNYKFVSNGEVIINGYEIEKQQVSLPELSGNYIVLYEENDFFGNLDNNRIVLKSQIKGIDLVNNKLNKIRYGYIFQDSNTNELYFSKDKSIIDNYSISENLKITYENLNKNGFTTKQINSYSYIILSDKNIKINKKIIEEVEKNNYLYITKISNSVNEYDNLAKKASPIVEKLGKHINAYRSKVLTKERLNEWSNDNKRGQLFLNQFKSINEVDNIYFDDFVDVENRDIRASLILLVLSSNEILGM